MLVTKIYTDGSHDNIKGISTFGVYFDDDTLPNLNGILDNSYFGAAGAELYAIFKAIQFIPIGLYYKRFTIYTDSKVSITAIAKNKHRLSNRINDVIEAIKNKGGRVKIKQVKSGSHGNHHADKLSFKTLAFARGQDPKDQYRHRVSSKPSYMYSDLATPYDPGATEKAKETKQTSLAPRLIVREIVKGSQYLEDYPSLLEAIMASKVSTDKKVKAKRNAQPKTIKNAQNTVLQHVYLLENGSEGQQRKCYVMNEKYQESLVTDEHAKSSGCLIF